MDEDNNHVRLQYRILLRRFLEDTRGLTFIPEEHVDRDLAPVAGPSLLPSAFLGEDPSPQSLIATALSASSTDDRTQSIFNTLVDDNTFWSTTGSQSAKVTDYGTYMLTSSLCSVSTVSICIYRAVYQTGEPIYPPRSVRFEIGHSPNHITAISPQYRVKRSDVLQTFVLPRNFPLGGFLRIHFVGRSQKQMEDMQFYNCVRYVRASGFVPAPRAIPLLLRGIRALAARPAQLRAAGITPAFVNYVLMPMLGEKIRSPARCASSEESVSESVAESGDAMAPPGRLCLGTAFMHWAQRKADRRRAKRR